MKGFERVALDLGELNREVAEFESFLGTSTHKRERAEIAPFFKPRKQLVAALGWAHPEILHPDRVSTELSLFGDFACDAASGDSTQKAFLLVEFEDAAESSVLRVRPKEDPGKLKGWSPRFEHGFSQLIDWAWRLDVEASGSPSMKRIFGVADPTIHFLLIAGRDSDLEDEDLDRLSWRARSVQFGSYRMSCRTFDGALASIKRRLVLAAGGNG